MKKYLLITYMCQLNLLGLAQIDSTLLKRVSVDTTSQSGMNMDAVYNRPFLQVGKLPVSIGGYLEADYQLARMESPMDTALDSQE